MLYTAINIALVVALVFTCGFSFAMLREFRRFKAHAGVYGEALREASRAMEQVDEALARTHDEGAQTVISLGERLEAAQRTLSELKTSEAAASAQLLRLRERIHEARDATSQADAAIRARDGSNGSDSPSAASAPIAASAGIGAARKKADNAGASGKSCGKSGGKTGSKKTTRANARTVERETGTPDAPETVVCAGNSRTLALAPAEATAQNAPRTRKILSWPVIRSAGIAAGA